MSKTTKPSPTKRQSASSFAKRVFAFMSDNVGTIISACSLLIALVALTYTITSQSNDLFYREALIRPKLDWHVDLESLTVRLTNEGLGPAVITHVSWRTNGRCYVANALDAVTWHKEREQFEAFLSSYFMDEVAESTGSLQSMVARPATLSAVPTPTQVIAAGKYVEIFALGAIDDFRRFLRTLPYQVGETFNKEFARRVSTLPITIGYCSFTGKYCAFATQLGLKPGEC